MCNAERPPAPFTSPLAYVGNDHLPSDLQAALNLAGAQAAHAGTIVFMTRSMCKEWSTRDCDQGLIRPDEGRDLKRWDDYLSIITNLYVAMSRDRRDAMRAARAVEAIHCTTRDRAVSYAYVAEAYRAQQIVATTAHLAAVAFGEEVILAIRATVTPEVLAAHFTGQTIEVDPEAVKERLPDVMLALWRRLAELPNHEPIVADARIEACKAAARRPASGELARQPSFKPAAYLMSWPEIVDALDLQNDEQHRERVKRCNDQYDGPIIPAPQGGQPRVNKAKLIEWWNRLEILWLTQANPDGAEQTAANRHRFGRDAEVVPDIGGAVKKRRTSKK